MFIVFEGIDKSGKSTLSQQLSSFLKEQGINVILTREPYNKNENFKNWTVRDFLIDRKKHEEEILLKHYDSKNTIVICDRYFFSTYAYQICGLGVNQELIFKLEKEIGVKNLSPHIVFFLDVSLEERKKRCQKDKEIKLDHFDQKEDNFFKKVRDGYFSFLATHPNTIILDADLPVSVLLNIITTETARIIDEFKNTQKTQKIIKLS